MSENPYAAPQSEIQTDVAIDVVLSKRPRATRGQRFAGHLIDYVILLFGTIAGISLAVFVGLFFYPDYLDMPETLLLSVIENTVVLVVLSMFFLATNGYLLVKRGQTVGKLIMKTQIVSDENEMLPLSKIFLARYFVFWFLSVLPVVGGLLSLANALMIFRGNRKCLHDELAGTKVVMLRAPAHYRKLPDRIEIP